MCILSKKYENLKVKFKDFTQFLDDTTKFFFFKVFKSGTKILKISFSGAKEKKKVGKH